MFNFILLLSVVALVFTAGKQIIFKIYNKEKVNLLQVTIVFFIVLIFLSYFLFDEFNVATRIFYAILYAMQTILVNEDVELIREVVGPSGISTQIYKGVMYVLFVILPLFSATTVLSYISNFIPLLRFKINIGKKDYHIFSNLNENTLAIADKIAKNNPKTKIIFTNKAQSLVTTENKNYVVIKEKINELNLKRINSNKSIYFMSEDDEANLNDCLELLNELTGDEKIKLYVLSSKNDAYMIIDSVISKKYKEAHVNEKKIEPTLQVEVINETERTVLQRLMKLPIVDVFGTNGKYDPNKKEVTVLIVGLRRVWKNIFEKYCMVFSGNRI